MERYESLGVVGEGSYGIVLRCRHKETGQTVAIKKFLESEDDHTVKKIALREVRMLKKLRHENLVNLIEFFRRKRRLYLVFEYVDHTILDELEAVETGLEESKARAHIFQVLRGIAFCHQNQIIHRDIKPENVLVSRMGVVKLCDFGFARLLAGPGESCTDYVATRWYRAPELLVGDTRYGREVDVWACGCLLSEMLTGEPLFPGESDIDQLFHIIQTLGELSLSHRQLMERNPMLAGLRLPAAASTPLMGSFPTWSGRAHSFVASCLCLEPSSRPHAQTLLSHDFFLHDNFPESFLPILRQKVQQEFNGNVLLGINRRRGSSTNERKPRSRKVPGGHSPESIYGGSIARPLPSQSTTTSRSENTPMVRASPTKPPISCQSQQLTPSTKQSVSFAPLTPSHQRSTVLSGPNSLAPPITEDAPSSPRSSLIPPLRDSHAITTLSSMISNPVPVTTNSSNTIALTLNITGTTNTASPARTSKLNEKGRKSPVNLWGSNTKSRGQGLCIQGQGQGTGQSQVHWDDDEHFGMMSDGPSSFISSSRYLMPDTNKINEGGRTMDLSRHPYTISLDRTKELFGRDTSHRDNSTHRDFSNRDPLREIKDNPRDPLGLNKELRESMRRPKVEFMGWAKPRLLNDDLSLPNVPGVTGSSNNGNSSPKKNSGSGPGGAGGWVVGNKTHQKPGVIMPVLSNIQRSSATSSDSTPPSSPLANLPYV